MKLQCSLLRMVSGKDAVRNHLGVIPGREGPFEVDMTRSTARQSRNSKLKLFLVCAIFYWPALAAAEWRRPQLVPVPVQVQGVSKPVLSLDGAWKFSLSPPNEFWLNGSVPSAWPDASVPGELVMQGFGISRDVEYAYKRRVVIPSIAMACTSRKRLPCGRGGKSGVQYG